MAGLGSLDTLYQTFLGQTNEAMNEPPAPWQQELMETVNPQKVRAQNIKRALAQASMALATTPGNFLTGLSAAAGTGANAYLTAQDEAEQQRMKAMQLVQMAQQKDKDRRLALLHDAFGVGRSLQNDKIAEEERQYGRRKDERQEARQTRLDDSLIRYRERPRIGGGAAGLSDNQVATIKRSIRREMDTERRRLEDEAEMNENLTPDEIERRVDDVRREAEDYYGISVDDGASGENPAPQVSNPSTSAANGSIVQPPNAAPKIMTKAQYDALPSGTVYIAPDGSQRRKP